MKKNLFKAGALRYQKPAIIAALFGLIIFMINSCEPLIDNTVYWPDTLVYHKNSSGNIITGIWDNNILADKNNLVNYLKFENDKLLRCANLYVREEENDVGSISEYELVSYDSYSFTVKKGKAEYTVHYLIVGNSITLTTDSGIINHYTYFKVDL